METINLQDFKLLWENALKHVKERADEFSRLDAVTGDGDHGTAIVQALSAVVDATAGGADFKTMLGNMGMGVMMETSGSTSTLLGGFLLGMGDGAEGTELNSAQVLDMFSSGLEGMRKQTKADIGDKTVMDAVIPAIEAMRNSGSSDISEMLSAAALAANKGAESTVKMKANFGRARNYGERSIGSADPGALSWASIFESFSRTVSELR